MRVLTIDEAPLVTGGGDIADAAQAGGALGGAAGVGYAISQGASGTAVLGFGGITAFVGAGVGASFATGYAIGNWGNSTWGWSDTVSSWASGISDWWYERF